MNTKEIECRFLEINKEDLIKKLNDLGAEDRGEVLLEEVIIYDSELKWRTENRLLKIRKSGEKITLTYKQHLDNTIDGTYEVEFGIDSFEKAEVLFEKIGFRPFRHQQKYRHTFVLNGVTFDIDTWPKIPTYVELEGDNEDEIKKMADLVGFNWTDAVFDNPSYVIENKYHIPVRSLNWFTFNRME